MSLHFPKTCPLILEKFFSPEESTSSLHALLKSPSFIYAAFWAEKPEKMAKSASQ
jgi:hypothetical protein